MHSIADALVYAVVYINTRVAGNDDQDVGALEVIGSYLRSATPEEQNALAVAAERALATEQSMSRGFIHDYAHWMEQMFGDEWKGNRRTSDTEG